MSTCASDVPLETVWTAGQVQPAHSLNSDTVTEKASGASESKCDVAEKDAEKDLSNRTRRLVGFGIFGGIILIVIVSLAAIFGTAGSPSANENSGSPGSSTPFSSSALLNSTAVQMQVLNIQPVPATEGASTANPLSLLAQGDSTLGYQIRNRVVKVLGLLNDPKLQSYSKSYRKAPVKRYVIAPGSSSFDNINEMLCVLAQARVYSVATKKYQATVDQSACQSLNSSGSAAIVTFFGFDITREERSRGFQYSGKLVGEVGEDIEQYEYDFQLTFGDECKGIELDRLGINMPGSDSELRTCVRGRVFHEKRRSEDGARILLKDFRILENAEDEIFNVSFDYRERSFDNSGRRKIMEKKILCTRDQTGENARGLLYTFELPTSENELTEELQNYICWNLKGNHAKFNAGETPEEACSDFSDLYPNDENAAEDEKENEREDDSSEDEKESESGQEDDQDDNRDDDNDDKKKKKKDDRQSNTVSREDNSICILRNATKEYPLNYLLYDSEYEAAQFGNTHLVLQYTGKTSSGVERRCYCFINRFYSDFTCEGVDGDVPDGLYPEGDIVLKDLVTNDKFRVTWSNAKVTYKTLVKYSLDEVQNKRRLKFNYKSENGEMKEIVLEYSRNGKWCIKYERTNSNGRWGQMKKSGACINVKELAQKSKILLSAAYMDDDKYSEESVEKEDYLDKEEGEMILDMDDLAVYGHKSQGVVQAQDEDVELFCALRCLNEVRLFGRTWCWQKTRCPKALFGNNEPEPYFEYDASTDDFDGSDKDRPYKIHRYVLSKSDQQLYKITDANGERTLVKQSSRVFSYQMYTGQPQRTEADLINHLTKSDTWKATVTIGPRTEKAARSMYLRRKVEETGRFTEFQVFEKPFFCAVNLQGDRNGKDEHMGAKYVLQFNSGGLEGGLNMRGKTLQIGDERLGMETYTVPYPPLKDDTECRHADGTRYYIKAAESIVLQKVMNDRACRQKIQVLVSPGELRDGQSKDLDDINVPRGPRQDNFPLCVVVGELQDDENCDFV